MRKLIRVAAGIFWALSCMGQTNSLPGATEPWGAATNGFQVSASITNSMVAAGAVLYFSMTVKNGSTNTIAMGGNYSQYGVPYVEVELVNRSWERFKIKPKRVNPRYLEPSIYVRPQVITNWNVRLPLIAFEESGAVKKIPSGDYTSRVDVKFLVKDNEILDAWSNQLNLKVTTDGKQ
jgi:hypothetical protein